MSREHRVADYRFGKFRYEVATGRLFRDGQDVSLAPRAAALLEHLLGRAGEVCPKEELIAEVWNGVNVGEESLTQAISVLRGGLGDDSKRPVWLETIPRRGYRFIGTVERQPPATTGAPVDDRDTASGSIIPWAIAAIAVLAAIVTIVTVGGRQARPGGVGAIAASTPVRFVIDLPYAPLKAAHNSPMGVSPDGTRLVLGRGNRLYLRDLDREELVGIAGTEKGGSPYFSPDGREIIFHASDSLKRLSLAGGAATTIVNTRGPRGGTWARDGYFYYARGPLGIFRVPVEGGAAERIVELETNEIARGAQPLPGGEWLLFAVNTDGNSWDDANIVVERLGTAERRTLLRGMDPRYLPSGHVIYARNGDLWAVAFDPTEAISRGEPVAVVDQVLQSPLVGAAYYALSNNGVLAYLQGVIGDEARRPLLWLDTDGGQTAIGNRETVDNPRLSPDERHLAAVGQANGDSAIWMHELGRGWTLLTTDGHGTNPIWSHDGAAVIFESVRGGRAAIWRRSVDFAGPAELVWQPPSDRVVAPESISADGRFLYFTSIAGGQADIWTLEMEGDRTALPVATLDNPVASEGSAIIHPSRRLLGYVSDESGRPEVYVRELVDPRTPGRRWQISSDGGDEPRWSRDGTTIYYRIEEQLVAVDVTLEPDFSRSEPRVLIESMLAEPPGARTEYDVSGDGRFVVAGLSGIDMALFSRIHVVVNWVTELERSVPTAR